MTVRELRHLLFNLPEQDIGIMILDGFNGGGVPREINFGPLDRIITAGDAEEAADCEGRTGESVIVLGYGFY